jgi:nitrilase
MSDHRFKIAAVQASPVYMDKDATVDKACRLIAEAGGSGARLVVFPETFIPSYPDWVWNVPPGKISLNQRLYGELVRQSVTIPGPAVDRLRAAALNAGVHVVIGVNQRNVDASGGTLYNTIVYIGPKGDLLGYHQKLIPTAPERTVWAYGDPSTLEVFDTDLGKMGGLICHENYMPLVRYSLYGSGIELYFAPTYDESEAWRCTLRHIAREGRVFVVGCCMVLRREDILSHSPQLEPYYAGKNEWINSGNSMIVNPNGKILAGPLDKEEGILYAEADIGILQGSRWNLDVAGHYARPDAFHLTVDRRPTPILSICKGTPDSHDAAGEDGKDPLKENSDPAE